MYEWALNADGEPEPISLAVPSAVYYCPVCGGRMIARLGDIKQHHFAHETLQFCAPEEVAGAAARRWIARRLQVCLAEERGVLIAWPCPICRQTHTTNLLKDVTHIQQEGEYQGRALDLALLDAQNTVRAAVTLRPPLAEDLRTYANPRLLVISVDATHGRFNDLPALLAGARIYNGPCATQITAAATGTITDPAELRKALVAAVSQPPYVVYGTLETYEEMTHVFAFGNQKLWLPPILWQRAIGGLLNTISPALQIISQEWPQDDGSTIALYYITARDTHAIAVRRFLPGQPVVARLNTVALRSDRLTALGVARGFAES
jgi:hypothetical protein